MLNGNRGSLPCSFSSRPRAKSKPCWKQIGGSAPKAIKYSDPDLTPDGLLRITLEAGEAGEAKIVVKGKGANLRMPAPAGPGLLGQDTKATVQLTKSDGGVCWEAVYPAPASKNTTGEFKDMLP